MDHFFLIVGSNVYIVRQLVTDLNLGGRLFFDNTPALGIQFWKMNNIQNVFFILENLDFPVLVGLGDRKGVVNCNVCNASYYHHIRVIVIVSEVVDRIPQNSH